MSYQSLARKYRPRTFNDLVGQEAAAQALRNAITLKREPCAVIFSGVRGVGKTTTARIYAKALNCSDRRNGEPCDTCASCKSINEGIHEDVLEIDGASHNGVDEVRQLQESLAYVNQRSPYKVFIIDEVHMLSLSAFNALLKTLEEPPSHVVFILATTNLQKVPQTIVGRCHTFHLQKISLLDIVERLRFILQQENIPFDEKALYLIAKEGQGSLRDAVTFLDQVIALGQGEVNLASLTRFLTQISNEVYLQILQALIQRDGKACIEQVDLLEQRGANFSQALEELASLARHSFILRDLSPAALNFAQLGLDQHEQAMLSELARKAQPLELNRLFRCLVRCKHDLDGSSLDRFVVENSLLEWCLDPGLPTTAELMTFAQGALSNDAPAEPRHQRASVKAPAPRAEAPQPSLQAPQHHALEKREQTPELSVEKPQPSVPQEKTLPASWPELVDQWKKHQPLEARKLEEVHLISYSASKIEVAVSEEGIVGPLLLKPDYQAKVTQQLAHLFNFKGTFRVVTAASIPNKSTTILEEKTQALKLKNERIAEAARSNPFTKAMVDTLGGKILRVQVKDETLPH